MLFRKGETIRIRPNKLVAEVFGYKILDISEKALFLQINDENAACGMGGSFYIPKTALISYGHEPWIYTLNEWWLNKLNRDVLVRLGRGDLIKL